MHQQIYQTIKILSLPKNDVLSKALGSHCSSPHHNNHPSLLSIKDTQLQVKLSPSPGDILKVLDRYDKFWIEVKQPHATSGLKGSCVWSECTTGYINTDDDMMGDGCDGDENWYQYRHNHSVQMLHIHCMDVKRVMLVH